MAGRWWTEIMVKWLVIKFNPAEVSKVSLWTVLLAIYENHDRQNIENKTVRPQNTFWLEILELYLGLFCVYVFMPRQKLHIPNRWSCFPTNHISSNRLYPLSSLWYRSFTHTYVCCFWKDHAPCFLQIGYPWILQRVSKETLPRIFSMPASKAFKWKVTFELKGQASLLHTKICGRFVEIVFLFALFNVRADEVDYLSYKREKRGRNWVDIFPT